MKKYLLIVLVNLSILGVSTAQSHYKPVKADHHHASASHSVKTKHTHDPETPDPGEESRELRKRQRIAKRERNSYKLEKDKENIRYERKRLHHDRLSGTYVPITKAGLKQHKRKLKEDKHAD